jgi:ferritin-like metal-binding protein YciE
MITNLHQLYIHQIKDLLSAETQITDALPKMIAHATDADLKQALEEHLKETGKQSERLNSILGNHHIPREKEKCRAIEGIIAEGEHLLKEMTGDAVDAGIIASAQRVEHYEIAAYGTAREYASKLDYDGDVTLLDETLEEEADCNEKLTKLATGGLFGTGVNDEAVRNAA